MANIAEEDWAGDGRRVKELITTSTVDIHYKNELIAIDDVPLSILRDNRLVSGLLIIVMISLSFWTIKRVPTDRSEN
jgi:hypothetical protein